MKYVCKYTPIELFAGFGIKPEPLNPSITNIDKSDRYIHGNVCSFSRSILEESLKDESGILVLTSCCNSVESAADVLKSTGREVYVINLPHSNNCCARLLFQKELTKLSNELERLTGRKFSPEKFRTAFQGNEEDVSGPYIAVMGARTSQDFLDIIIKKSPLPVKNNTCTGLHSLPAPPDTDDTEKLMDWYADALLCQIPCSRMCDISERRHLTEDPNLRGIIYNTVSFCDFYSFEYARLKSALDIPILKIETDYTSSAAGQAATRLEAFFESLGKKTEKKAETPFISHRYYAGIDSGSTTTNAVIIDDKKNIIAFATVPTGVRVAESARAALNRALNASGLEFGDICRTVTTGYGRAMIDFRTRDVTEITCHARGAYFLNPKVRTIIDIGGQDSKVIRLDSKGNVIDFAMNDKCAAGTGRFIEMMAMSLQLSLEEMSTCGLDWKEDIVITSMCSVFAQSEVVSLIAAGKRPEDIIHGINNAIASRVVSLGKTGKLEREFMMTGGVARNAGVVRAIEEKLGNKITVPEEPDICGALGAALIASESQ